MEKKNKIVSTITGFLALACIIGILAFTAKITGVFDKGDNTSSAQRLTLDDVKNISYNNNVLTWGEVKNADSYLVKCNDKVVTVNDNQMEYFPKDYINVVEIKAKDSTCNYLESANWSSIEVNINKNDHNLESLLAFQRSTTYEENEKMEKIFAYEYIANDALYIYGLNSENKVLYFVGSNKNNYNSLEDFLNGDRRHCFTNVDDNRIADEKCLEYFLNNSVLTGELGSFAQKGEKINVISNLSFAMSKSLNDLIKCYAIIENNGNYACCDVFFFINNIESDYIDINNIENLSENAEIECSNTNNVTIFEKGSLEENIAKEMQQRNKNSTNNKTTINSTNY